MKAPTAFYLFGYLPAEIKLSIISYAIDYYLQQPYHTITVRIAEQSPTLSVSSFPSLLYVDRLFRSEALKCFPQATIRLFSEAFMYDSPWNQRTMSFSHPLLIVTPLTVLHLDLRSADLRETDLMGWMHSLSPCLLSQLRVLHLEARNHDIATATANLMDVDGGLLLAELKLVTWAIETTSLRNWPIKAYMPDDTIWCGIYGFYRSNVGGMRKVGIVGYVKEKRFSRWYHGVGIIGWYFDALWRSALSGPEE